MSEAETLSEQLFEKYCSENGIKFKKIKTDEQRTPDYDIYTPSSRVVIEVKQIDPNKEDRVAEKELMEGKCALISDSPGRRIRKKITDAAPQISRRAKGKAPSILVLYNNVLVANYTAPYNIKTGMYGYETIVFGVTKDRLLGVRELDRKFGPKRKVTPMANTSLSAVGVLVQSDDIELLVYHNIYAAIPLLPKTFNFKSTKHFSLSENRRGIHQDWVEIKI